MTSTTTHTNYTTPDEGCAVIGEVSECGPQRVATPASSPRQ